MGNTVGIDMGNTFHFISRPFHGHVVERTLFCGATVGVCEVGVEGPTKHVAVVSVVWMSRKSGYKWKARFEREGPLRSARSGLSAASFAAANYAGVAEADSAVAPTTSELGQPEAGRSVAEGTSASSGSLCADDRQVAEADETESSSASTFAARATTEARRIDHLSAEQPGVDGGFQRLVSDSEWPAGGTADGAGFVQSLSAGGPIAQGSGLEASPPGLYATCSGRTDIPPSFVWTTVDPSDRPGRLGFRD